MPIVPISQMMTAGCGEDKYIAQYCYLVCKDKGG